MNIPPATIKAYTQLTGIVLGASFLWLIVLPHLSDIPSVRSRIEKNRAAGINPTAVFYTDHPGMSGIERNVAARVEHPNNSFWTPGNP